MVTPTEKLYSIKGCMKLLGLSDSTDFRSYFATSRSIMTDEGSALVKLASSMKGYHHYLCSFNINQLPIWVSYVFVLLLFLTTHFS